MKVYTCRIVAKIESTSEQDACEKIKKYCDIVNSYSENDANLKMKLIFLSEEGIDIDTVKKEQDPNTVCIKYLN